MSQPANIDTFNRGCALLLNHLYANFPVPIRVLDAGKLDDYADLLPEQVQERTQRVAIYAATVVFLADEGYLRFGSQSGNKEMFSQVVLTSKGLSALNRIPKSLDGSRPVWSYLQDITKDGLSEMVKLGLGQLLGG